MTTLNEQFKLLAKSNQFKDVTVEAPSDEAEQDYITCYSLYRDGDVVCKTLDNFYSLPEDFRELAKRELGILIGRIVTGKQIGRASCRERVLRLV